MVVVPTMYLRYGRRQSVIPPATRIVFEGLDS